MTHPAVVAAAALLLGVLASGAARADDVLIVLSSEAGPYREAGVACAAQLKKLGHTSRTVQLADVKSNPTGYAAIVALGTPAAVALHRSQNDRTALLYAMVSQPDGVGLTTDRPTIGVSTDVPLSPQVKLIGDALPSARRVGMLYRSNDDASRSRADELRAQLPEGWTLLAVAINDYDAPADAIDALLAKRPDIVWTEADASIYNAATIRTLLLSGLRRGVPVFGFSSGFVKAGALVGVTINASEQGAQVAELAHETLSGRDAAGPRVVEPRYGVALNLIVAQTLGLKVPEAVQKSAAVVYREGDK